MGKHERFGIWGDHHPIDLVQSFARDKNWPFERISDDQITIIIEGVWQNYSVSIDLSSQRESLSLICAFDMNPADTVLPSLYETLNLINGEDFAGGFSFWRDQQLLVYQYTMVMSGGAMVLASQLEQMLGECIYNCDKYYPVFQLVGWAIEQPQSAINMAIPAAAGRA